MKKLLYATLSFFFFLSFLTTSKAAPDGVALKDLQNNQRLMELIKGEDANRLVGEIILFPREPFNLEQSAEIINTITSLPESLLKKIHQAGIVIRLFNGKLTDNPSAQHLKGVIPRGYTNEMTWDDVPGIGGSKVVLVKIGASSRGNGHGSINLELHELAHSVDKLVFHNLSKREPFKSVWEKERASLFPGRDYFLTYSEEYFAEAFALYYYSDDTNFLLKDKAPLTYDIIKGLD
ncbi:anthrax toxin lethal factor-related metalloendopeptidase [Neobacillus sp. YIM B06451]|uniref:anthrax toxin lethal factor-related metalloendopeptidase n=1 Tax=Neobacillus sp. YIM B06451 TaxID=3070994 RepID=UPI00292F12F0|nr:toxin [Neobacillus sp. YIM B06451]